jgi:hypothetical protein
MRSRRFLLVLFLALYGCGDRISLGTLPGDPQDPASLYPKERDTDDASTDGGGPWTPCGGKACGATCNLCPPGSLDCSEAAVVKYCHPSGECLAVAPACTPPSPHQPCANKICGQGCKLCDPKDPNCVETAVVKRCNTMGVCSPDAPGC